jgi:hypothetical protein
MCYKAGRYARRSDPYRRDYYSGGSSSAPASRQDVSPVGGCGVLLFMFGGLLALVCPPVGFIFLLIGGIAAGGSAVASNRSEESKTREPAAPIAPTMIEPNEKCVCGCCGQNLEFPAAMAGQQIACPACEQQIVLPNG